MADRKESFSRPAEVLNAIVFAVAGAICESGKRNQRSNGACGSAKQRARRETFQSGSVPDELIEKGNETYPTDVFARQDIL
jgi:hypothetical protein